MRYYSISYNIAIVSLKKEGPPRNDIPYFYNPLYGITSLGSESTPDLYSHK